MGQIVKGRQFVAPGPGSWELDAVHMPRPMTLFAAEVMEKEFGRGFAEGSAKFGVMLDHLEGKAIHHFWYHTPRPVGAPKNASGPPPKFIFKLMVMLHPAIRRRLKAAKQALATRAWLEDLKEWDETWKPRAIRENLEIQRVDPTTLDNEALADHLAKCRQNAANGVYRHHRFTVTSTLPIGDFLAHATDWTGKPVPKLLQLFRGYSPVSVGVAAPELDQLVQALRASGQTELLTNGTADEIISNLRQADGDVGETAGKYIEAIGYRMVTGYDICDRYALEMPDMLVKVIREILDSATPENVKDDVAEQTAKIRELVPAEHREMFDQLLDDARALYRLRDERGSYNDGWASGLARRGILAAGQKLADQGSIDSAELLIDATFDEMMTLLAGTGGPSSETLRERAEWRNSVTIEDVPAWLGAPPSAPPPADWLPPAGARIARAMDTLLASLFGSSTVTGDAKVVRGIPVSSGTYEGPIRLVTSVTDFDKIQPGDVLLTPSTSPYFNPVLPLLGALITDRGGALSHAAIVAREYGIPGVVGCNTAIATIPDGARVRVDGDAGEITILP